MKLFFDENLSQALPRLLALEFPGSTHPRLCQMAGCTDHAIKKFAAMNGFIVVTRDIDLPNLVRFSGSPPKVIWLEFHNPSTRVIASALRLNLEQIEAFAVEQTTSVLVIRQVES